MTEAEQFLAAIVADPEADLPRLVFADWLEEHGDADRAEFIRLHCALAADAVPPAERDPAEGRCHELLNRHRTAWAVPGVPGVQQFRRGFVEYLRIGTGDLLRHQMRFADAAPITSLRLSTNPERLQDVVVVPWLARLREFAIAGMSVGPRLRKLFRPGLFPELRTLRLQNNPLWADDVGTLVQLGDSWPKLRTLDLSGNPVSDEGLAILAASDLMGRLSELVLRSDGIQELDRVHAAGAAALAAAPAAAGLERLGLYNQNVGDDGLRVLLTSPNLSRLEVLDATQNLIGEDGSLWADALPVGTRLRRLCLARNRVYEPTAKVLIAWLARQPACVVDLRDCEFPDGADEVLEHCGVRSQVVLDGDDDP